ncbi:MAG TPA: YggT family protein [Caulobacteraceae bacterium]|jgi:YggT family protein
MQALIEFAILILHLLIQAAIWVVIANAVVSWLIAFDVINMRNGTARQVVHFLDAVTRPMLRPFRRFIPPLGGVDVTPVVLIIILEAADQVLLPALGRWLLSLVGVTVI